MTVAALTKTLLIRPGVRAVLRRAGMALAILLVIAWLTLFGLILAERGREGLPARPPEAALEAIGRTAAYLIDHPATYYWHKQDVSAPDLVLTLLGRSAGLLLLALGIAAVLGVPLGIGMALSRRQALAPVVLLLSILGVSTPSFLLAMLFWVINIQIYRQMGMDSAPLPPTGFGWDAHMVMPALVLAARPLAQVVQVTYVSMSSVLREDYVRTAQSKGLAERLVLTRHVLRNVLIPLLTTLGTSLRFSLASLPVVEYFFVWPGAGLTLLQAIEAGTSLLVTDLIVSLGFFFLLVNLALEVVYQIVDPRLRGDSPEQREEQQTWQERLAQLKDTLVGWWSDLLAALRLNRQPSQLVPLPAQIVSNSRAANDALLISAASRRHLLRNTLGNPTLIVGTMLILAFFGLAFFGEQLTQANPDEAHGTMVIEGQLKASPFSPSTVFPWGSDMIGRDIQALVLAGAKQTLALALAGTAARVLLGTALGLVAGWWRGSWLDRVVTGVVAVWAAFPVTLFAMILILALGIQQGRPVFIVALCIVGWGETAQFVRGQVIALKPQPYIEAARAAGARSGRILSWHILPQLLPSLLVLAALEMGGILMLLAELGFLNIFLGGGFKVELTSEKIFHYSDVPEWGALLANIRDWWRSYPWMAWYPGIAFFAAIVGFNLWADGLRRLLEATRINVNRLLNRYTVVTVGVLVMGLVWVLRSTAPMEVYQTQAKKFDAQRAMEDIRILSSSLPQGDVMHGRLPASEGESQSLSSGQFNGRESGTPGTRLAAEYIARRMEEIGLSPAGDGVTYIQTFVCSRYHLVETPRLEILDGRGGMTQSLTYRQDFAEYVHLLPTFGDSQGAIVGMALGPDPETSGADIYNLNSLSLGDKIVILREPDMLRVNVPAMAGALFVSDDPAKVKDKRNIFGGDETVALRRFNYKSKPVIYITPQAADKLLATAGSSLSELDNMAKGLQPGKVALTSVGTKVRIKVAAEEPQDPPDRCYNVIGFIPGVGSEMGPAKGQGLDSRVIMVSAYYDGLGVGPDGTLYPGANDNASGVATMLEMARVLKQSTAQPKKTIVFVAWSGGERRESLSLFNVMNAKAGFGLLSVETVIELSGVGAGDGRGIALGQGSSFQLVQTFQDAAGRLGVSTTTRGRGPHFGLYTALAFGGRSALTAYLSWDGSDRTAHTADDTVERIDPNKLRQVGQTALLVVSVLSQGTETQQAAKP
jgi:peptide/nickel transport system permease protein